MRNILFLCTGNSARSILGEALVNALPCSRERFHAYSAGSHPRGEVHPQALITLRERGIAIQGLRSKSWDEFADGRSTVRLDLVITVCGNAAGETCPYWPGTPLSAHWGLPDPAAAADDAIRQAFEQTADALTQRIERLALLPFEGTALEVIRQQIQEIGLT